jgi:plastocyanin
LFTENRFRLRVLALPAAILSLALVTGCGDDDDESSDSGGDAATAKPLDIDLSGAGDKVAFDVPKQVEAGLTEITINNGTQKPQDLQLILVQGDHSAQEVVKAFQQVGQGGKPIPSWFLAGGGTGTVPPGQSGSVTQVLESGTYYGFTTGGQGYTPIEVTGDAADAGLPEADATVTAFEYGFEGEGLEAGKNEVLFENTGAQPHHAIIAPIIGDATIEDVKTFIKTEKGKPPIAFEQETSTAVLEGGDGQVTTLNLEKPGRYAFLCFISDRQGGPPHALKGMISEIEVE